MMKTAIAKREKFLDSWEDSGSTYEEGEIQEAERGFSPFKGTKTKAAETKSTKIKRRMNRYREGNRETRLIISGMTKLKMRTNFRTTTTKTTATVLTMTTMATTMKTTIRKKRLASDEGKETYRKCCTCSRRLREGFEGKSRKTLA